MAADPLLGQVLDAFDTWRPAAAASRRVAELPPSALREAIGVLARLSLLERSDRSQPHALALESWSAWNPAAGLFHFSTKDTPYVDVAAAERQLRRKARLLPPPPFVKRARARIVTLPPPDVAGELPATLLARRTWRRFGPEPLSLASLATLLGLSFGVQRWMDLGAQGRAPLRTSPSGGARHSIEAYVLCLRVKGVARGLYRYAPDRHGLEPIKPGASARQALRYLPTQWWYGKAAALVLMTAVFPRVQWRYEFPRAYRAVLIEAGHFCQTFLLAATWLGLAPFCSMALADSRIEADLGIDGVTESVLYAAGVGTRPRDVNWAPWPPARRATSRSRRRPAPPGSRRARRR